MAFRIALMAGLLLGQVKANAPLARTPLASTPVAAQPSIVCRTELGTESVAIIPTSTVTHTSYDTHPVVVYSTFQDTVTVTPTASWLSLTEYATSTVTVTADTITDTFSTTSTQYTTATSTLTLPPVTATSVTTISVLSTTTSTISAASGLTPIADTMATPTAQKRELYENTEDSCPNWVGDYQYATAVECVATVVFKTTTTSTVTESPATTTVAEPTSTTTATSTVTSSSTVLPSDASTTLSYSTLLTVTETSTAPAVTSTVTSSTTVVSGVTTTSFYAACATNNIASAPLSSDFGSLAGQYVYEISFTDVPGEGLSTVSKSSQYDCCVACQQNSKCAFAYMFTTGSNCYIMTTSVCSSATYGNAETESSPTDGAITVSNGPCGRILSN